METPYPNHYPYRTIATATCTLLIVLFLCLTPSFAASGINHQINFQGKLVNSDGTNVADSTYTIVFSLYTVSSGGSNVWTETDSVTTKDGVFRVALGAGTTFASQSIDFNSDTYYLGVKVGSDAEMTPRVQFAAVPYAFNAQEVNGLSVTNNGGNTLNIAANKTFTVSNSLTFAGTDATSFTFPSTSGGTVLTTNQSSQTINSGQTSGTILSLAAGAPSLSGGLTGASITLNGTGSQNETGLSFAVTAAGGTLKDINGTSGNWSVTAAGAGTFASLTSSGLITANGGLTIPSGQNLTLNGMTSGSIPFYNSSHQEAQDNANLFWDATNKRLGIGNNSSLLGTLDLRSTLGTLPIASISGQTSFAGLVLDNSGIGDLFTASSSGLSRFTVQQSGTLVLGADVSTPSAVTVRGGAASGTNTAGANVTFDAANGTGTGGSGSFIFRSAAPSNGVIKDATGSTGASSVSSLTFSVTTGSHSNTILLVSASNYTTPAAVTVSSVTYNGTNLTKLSSQSLANCKPNGGGGAGCDDELWYLKSPPSGSYNVIVTFSGTALYAAAGAVTYYNVDQVNTFGTVATNTGSGTSSTLTVSSVTTSQLVLDVAELISNGSTPGVNAGQTQVWNQNAISNTVFYDSASSKTGVTGSTTFGWTNLDSTYGWIDIGVPINTPANTSANTLTQRLQIDPSGNVVIGNGSLATNATNGFLYLDTSAGAPSGTPTSFTGTAATEYDTTNNKLCVYNAAWKCSGAFSDYAEWAPAQEAEAGDIVAITDLKNPVDDPTAPFMLGKTTTPYDSKMVGVISQYAEDANMANGYKRSPDYHAVALSGRVPVKVSTINGTIQPGDYLTSSSLPGVAQKATQAGEIIGKATQAYTASDSAQIGSILAFISPSYADPTVQITQTGDLAVNGQPVGGSLTTLPTLSADILSATGSAALVQTHPVAADQFLQLQGAVTSLQTAYASLSAQLTKRSRIDDLSMRVANLEKTVNLSTLFQNTATPAAALDLGSADATISGNLTVLGRTVLSDLGVTGTISSGVLTINGLDDTTGTASASLNTLAGPLKLQSLGLGGLDLLNGKVTIDTSGNVTITQSLTAKKYLIDTHDPLAASAGQADIPAGKTTIDVSTTALTGKSLIFATPIATPAAVSTSILGPTTFELRIKDALSTDMKVNWWIVN